MILAKVIGNIVSTRKNQNLTGYKLLVLQLCENMGAEGSNQLVAVDTVGAGIGEYVIVATGSAARVGTGGENAPIDAAVVGIVDSI